MAVTDSVKTGGNDSVSDPQMTKTLIAMTSQEHDNSLVLQHGDNGHIFRLLTQVCDQRSHT